MKVSDGFNEVQGIADVIVDRIEQDKPPTIEEEALAKEVELLKAKTQALEKVKIAAPADTESIEEKISALSIQAEEAKQQAQQRQEAAKNIAEKERDRLQEEQLALMERLRNTQEENARIALEKQLAATEKNLETLTRAASAKQEASAQTNTADQEAELLRRELENLKLEIIAQQKAYINEKITALKEDQAKETDREKKFSLGLDIQKLERYKASNDLLGEFATEYKEGLLSRKSALEAQLAAATNDQSKILIQGQIGAIEGQLFNLERLEKIRLDIANAELAGNTSFALDDQAEFQGYIEDRIQALIDEQNEINQWLLTETDSLQIEAYKARLAEIDILLSELGFAKESKLDVDQILLVAAKQEIAEASIQNQEAALKQTDANAANRIQAKADDLKAQLKALQSLDKSGMSPDMTVYDLRDELLTKKDELVNEFRVEKDLVNLEKLRSKVTVLDRSLKILEGLESSGVSEDDSLEKSQAVLNNTRLNLTRNYVAQKDERQKVELLKEIQSVTRQQQLLAKFYDPQARLVTLGNVKNDLESEYRVALENQREAQTNDQKLFYDNQIEEIEYQQVMIKRIENSLREIIQLDFEAQLEEYKANLLAELNEIEDEDEKKRLQAEIDGLDIEALKVAGLGQRNYFQGLIADLVINVDTRLFLYGQTPAEHSQAVFFEWNLDDGRTLTGQNIDFSYRDPGFYRVKLNISDGLTETEDSLTIKVMPKSDTTQSDEADESVEQ